MNTFWDYEDIFGKVETAHLNRTMNEFLELTVTIRSRLGKQGYLLDKYISIILEAANATLLYDAAERGFSASSELRHLCLSVMDGKADCADHPLYEKVREYIGSHPLEYLEVPTKQSLYCIALAGDFLEHTAAEYYQRQKEKQREVFDIVYLRDLYRKISAMLGGEEQMERLNLLLRQRFLIVTPIQGFLQGLTNDLLYCLTHRDVETSKLAVQLLLGERAGKLNDSPPGQDSGAKPE